MHRLLRWLITSVTGGLVVLLGLTCLAGWRALPGALAATPTVPAVVRAQRLVVLDATGAARAALGMEDAAAGLTLYAKDGSKRLGLFSDADKTSIHFFDEHHVMRLTCETTEERGSVLGTFDAQARPGLILGVKPDGLPKLLLASGTAQLCRLEVGLMPAGTPRLALGGDFSAQHPSGMMTLTLTDKRMPMVALYDKEGVMRSLHMLAASERPTWTLVDRTRHLRAIFDDEGTACSLSLRDAAGQKRFILGAFCAIGFVCTLSDAKPCSRIILGIRQATNLPLLTFYDQQETTRIACYATDTDAGITWYDRTEGVRCELTDFPSIQCNAAKEFLRTLVCAPSGNRSPSLQFCDPSGKALLWSAPPVR